MTSYTFRILLTATGLIGTLHSTQAQNMNTPYSIYGLGDIDHHVYNRTSGMGGAGLARLSSFYLIDNNPAALTGLTRSFYLIDAAATGKTIRYRGSGIDASNSNNKDFWIKRLSVAVKINGFWASSFGFGQFSNVNYAYSDSKAVEGSTTRYTTIQTGDGGLNEYYWINSVALGKHLSLGLRSSIIAGGINRNETITDAGLSQPILTKVQDYYGSARFQAGGIYTHDLGKKWNLALGARFSPRVKMVAERALTVVEGSTSLISDNFVGNGRFDLPRSWGTGLALKHNNRTTYALDYTYEDWSSVGIRKQGWQMVSSHKLSGGIEFARQAVVGNMLLEKRYFQVGGFLAKSPLQISNKSVNEFGITAGMGGVLGRNLIYTLAIEAGQRGTTQQNLIRENYGQLTISLSYRDFFLSKGRKYD